MNGQARNLVFKASGAMGAEGATRAMVLLAFESDAGSVGQGWPAVLRVADANGRKASTRGRVFGFGEARAITFSSVIGHSADDRPIFVDLLRADWNHGENRVTGIFLPPVAACQVSALYRRLRGSDTALSAAVRSEIDAITTTYGQLVDLPVRMAAPGLRPRAHVEPLLRSGSPGMGAG